MSKADRVTEDAHAARRLNDLDVELHESPGHALASYEGDGFAVVAFATDGADNGRLHEAMAASYQQLTLSLELRDGRQR